ncbi:MAG TPA: hypothetical protein VHF67_11485 [Gaiellaceae bacterium]|nr:hypothetical protein [Gaiellaceae bacterium]
MRRVPTRKALTVAAAALVVTGGGGAAIAASQSEGPSPSSFLDAVARHLGVSRDELDDATKAAALDQVDAALEAGRITEEQADELRSRIESGEVPPFFGPFFGGFHHRMHGLGADLCAAAEYLDLSVGELRGRLARGQSLADVAEAQDKPVDGVEQAMLREAEQRLDDAVADRTMTREQADEMLERLRCRIDAIVNGELPRWRGHHGGRPPFRHL